MSSLFPAPEKYKAKKTPWNKRSAESAHAFDLFEHFLHSENRSLEATSQYYKVDLPYVQNLYKDYNWESRALAYDHNKLNEEIDIQVLDPEELTREDMHEKHFKIAEYAENIAIKGFYILDKYINEAEVARQQGQDAPKAPPLTAEQIIKVADFATKLKRLTLGEAGSITEHKSSMDYSKLSMDELKKLKELAEKTKPANAQEDSDG